MAGHRISFRLRAHLLLFVGALLAAGSGVPGAQAQHAPLHTDTTRTDTTRTDTTRTDTTRVLLHRTAPLALPPLTVEADRLAGAERHTAQHLTRLDAADLERAGAHTAAELLERRSGLFVRQYGAGGLATASVRGLSSQQTLVLVDGQRVTDPQSGQIDLSLLPTALLASAEVQPGAAAGRYGSGSLGGVVHLRTLQPTEALRLKLSGGAGGLGEWRGGGIVSGGWGRLRALAAAEWSRIDGDFRYTNEALFPAREVRRKGAGRSLATVFGKVSYDAGRHRLSLTGWVNEVERGLPGTSNARLSKFDQPTARQWDAHRRLLARSRSRFGWGTLTLDARAQRTRLRYANPAAQQRDTAQTTTLAATARAEAALGTHWFATGGVETGLDRARLRGGVQRTRAAAFASGEGVYGRWLFQPALRLDTYASGEAPNETALSPQIGLSVQPLAWEGLRLKGRLSRAFRVPTFGERFYEPGGNPDLRTEKGWSAEAGLAVEAERARAGLAAEATVFMTRLRDQVVWHPSYVGPGLQVWTPRNVGRVRTRGLEASLEGHLRLAEALHVDGGLFATYTDAQNRANPDAAAFGKQLRYVPRAQLKWQLGAAWRGLRLDLSGRLASRRYVASDESQAVPAYHVVDAQLGYERAVGGARVSLGLGVENVFDASYQIVQFYPMPPRRACLRLTLQTGP